MPKQQPCVSRSEEGIELNTGRISLRFEFQHERLMLTSLRLDQASEFLGPYPNAASLWVITLQNRNGKRLTLSSSEFALSGSRLRNTETGGSVVFVWSAPSLGAKTSVEMRVRCRRGDGITEWALSLRSLPRGWAVEEIAFPIIPNLRSGDGLRLAAPAGWGLEYADPGRRDAYSGVYPSLVAAMQFLTLYRNGHGLYLGTHDPTASLKQFSVGKADTVGVFASQIVNWPAMRYDGGDFALPYEAKVGIYRGDWYDAAQIYREWSFRTKWGRGGAVSKRAIPGWMKEIDLWLRLDTEPSANLSDCTQAREFFQVPTGLHCYNWHQIPFDTLYPEYFPARPGFEKGVRELQRFGFHVMPYINGRLWDPASESWKKEHADRSAARKDDGSFYTEVYGSKVPLNVMCPYTELWQKKVVSLVDRLVNQCGVNGVYIDQICAAAGVRCLATNHGHAPGGGSAWSDGYRTLLSRVRAILPRGTTITTEENADPWLDQFDGLLIVNTPMSSAQPIPLFLAVYSGRTILFGFQYLNEQDFERKLPFRAKMARCFTWGSQMGWVRVAQIMSPSNAVEAQFLRDLAQCHSHARKFLTFGRFLGVVPVDGDNTALQGEGTGWGAAYPISISAVIASAWQAEDGGLAIAMANCSNQERRVTVALPTDRVKLPGSQKFTVRVIGADGEESLTTSTSLSRVLTMPPLSGKIIEFAPAKRSR